jgi:hypothetical protein
VAHGLGIRGVVLLSAGRGGTENSDRSQAVSLLMITDWRDAYACAALGKNTVDFDVRVCVYHAEDKRAFSVVGPPRCIHWREGYSLRNRSNLLVTVAYVDCMFSPTQPGCVHHQGRAKPRHTQCGAIRR